jgi:Phosphotransferase enzyme family
VLTPTTFADLAQRVTLWLLELAEGAPIRPRDEWWARLVGEPLEQLEREFGPAIGQDAIRHARRLLDDLGDMPQVPEHRDCSPWNVVMTGSGSPALLDWESAEPRGLPALDLFYFLANAAFVLDKALESGNTRDSYASLLDPRTEYGRVAAACLDQYSERLGLDRSTLSRLRLLSWIVHCRSEHGHAAMEFAGIPDTGTLRRGVYAGLLEEELKRA